VIMPPRDDDPGRAGLWVAPARPEIVKAVRRFVLGDPARRAVIVGEPNGTVPAGVVHSRSTPSELHVALQAVVAR
jgi:hypothetical protein